MRASPLFPAIRQLLRGQALVVAAAVWIAYLAGGEQAARSSLLGGLAAFLPNAYFATRVGKSQNKKTAREIVHSFYVGETVKLVSTALLFSLVLQLPNVVFAPLIATFVAVLTVFWFALLLNDNPTK
ncbi:ATP synthase subunit I [Methylogaea oryzae]|uniref:ATP synthase subunit I n=1 Tax=Methylogaea oryzae TaxID=1295382 RepID=A0A8D4VQW1_9GAMM|nr:ATP synthase subunit I [Methylogaea oryzae]BBL72878.1 ATP synthase subunit I [Methylogaea oryzae]